MSTSTQYRQTYQPSTHVDAYNHTRRHSSCEMKPPVVYEQLLADRAAEAAQAADDPRKAA